MERNYRKWERKSERAVLIARRGPGSPSSGLGGSHRLESLHAATGHATGNETARPRAPVVVRSSPPLPPRTGGPSGPPVPDLDRPLEPILVAIGDGPERLASEESAQRVAGALGVATQQPATPSSALGAELASDSRASPDRFGERRGRSVPRKGNASSSFPGAADRVPV